MSDPVRARVAAAFAGWGIPTTDALIRARSAAPDGVHHRERRCARRHRRRQGADARRRLGRDRRAARARRGRGRRGARGDGRGDPRGAAPRDVLRRRGACRRALRATHASSVATGRRSDGADRVRRSTRPTRTAASWCSHYENFTVASRLSPRSLRRDLTRVYAFCRYTDDLGDESGDRAVAMRRLRRWRDEVRESFEYDERTHPVLVALADTVRRFRPRGATVRRPDRRQPAGPARRHATRTGLRCAAYCTRSAAPVGRIVLRLFDIDDARCGRAQRRRLHRSAARELRAGRLGRQRVSVAPTCCSATSASTASTARRAPVRSRAHAARTRVASSSGWHRRGCACSSRSTGSAARRSSTRSPHATTAPRRNARPSIAPRECASRPRRSPPALHRDATRDATGSA